MILHIGCRFILDQVTMLPRYNWIIDATMSVYVAMTRKSATKCVWIFWSHISYYLLVCWQLWIPVMSEEMVTHAWMPSELPGCTGVHSTYTVTNKIQQNTFLNYVQEKFDENICYGQGIKCLWMLVPPQSLEWCKGHTNDIELGFGFRRVLLWASIPRSIMLWLL